MYNKDLFEKICNVTCTFSELEDFVVGINKKEFDLDNPFEKHYGIDKILAAIELYQAKRTDARFLANWMNAYNWIVMGGFKQDSDNTESLKRLIIWEISDWLDSLSFFDGDEEFYNLNDYKVTFSNFDRVLKSVDECTATVAPDINDEEGEDGIIFVVNDKEKFIIKFYDQLEYIKEDWDFPIVDGQELQNTEKELLKQGYEKLKYGPSEYYDEF